MKKLLLLMVLLAFGLSASAQTDDFRAAYEFFRNYPGHLATAIAVGEDAKGDYIRIDGVKFLICAPTYINAPIGMTMPDMDNKTAKVIVLK